MLIGHLPAGYFTTKFLLKKFKLPFNKKWFFIGLIGSILPDFDIAYLILFGQPGASHRNYFSNYPFLYLILFLLLLIISLIIKNKWLKLGNLILFANILVHFILDTAFVGIKWFWPFYTELIGIYNIGHNRGLLVKNYFEHWYWYLEISFWLLAIVSIIISVKKGEIK